MTLGSDIDRFINKVHRRMEATTKGALSRVATELVNRSPVDTGHFKANWQFSVGSPPQGILTNEDPSGGETLGRLLGEIRSTPMPKGVHGYFRNNVPYALKLEYGHSTQAPQGIVRITMTRWRSFIAQAAWDARRKIP